jgi:hypothetical protein
MDRDRYLQRLHYYLSKAPIKNLRSYGWFDFKNIELSVSGDPLDIAVEDFLYLSLSLDDGWRNDIRILPGIFGFLKEQTGIWPEDKEFIAHKKILQENPVNKEDIKEWFRNIYAPND